MCKKRNGVRTGLTACSALFPRGLAHSFLGFADTQYLPCEQSPYFFHNNNPPSVAGAL